ncbi:MAG: hypothetical protein M0P43_11025 [Arcobacteraceae bacterium]|nr:hypothetical protein [Arcobacteraceae bacterium]
MDINYYETQPPRIQGTDFPPVDSLHKEYGRSTLSLDDVIDPKYPWQNINTDTQEGIAAAKSIKNKKSEEVLEYVLVRNRYWHQFASPEYFPNDEKLTITIEKGSSTTKTSSVETSIEADLGLQKGVFSANLKSSLQWDDICQESFSEKITITKEQTFRGNCWYLYWQTMQELAIYRRTEANPDALSLVKKTVGAMEIEKLDPNIIDSMLEHASSPRLQSGNIVLNRGQSHTFGAWVFGKTQLSFQNTDKYGEAQITMTWAGTNRDVVNIPAKNIDTGETGIKSVMRYYFAGVSVTNSGNVDGLVVWSS